MFVAPTATTFSHLDRSSRLHLARARPQSPHLKRLCADLSGMLRSEGREDILLHANHCELPTSCIVPLGLILNELVTNAAKHGRGRISVTFEELPSESYGLSVSDEGAALAEGFDPAAASGLGMKVIRSLAGQLGGELVVDAAVAGGTRFTVRFPPGVDGSALEQRDRRVACASRNG